MKVKKICIIYCLIMCSTFNSILHSEQVLKKGPITYNYMGPDGCLHHEVYARLCIDVDNNDHTGKLTISVKRELLAENQSQAGSDECILKYNCYINDELQSPHNLDLSGGK